MDSPYTTKKADFAHFRNFLLEELNSGQTNRQVQNQYFQQSKWYVLFSVTHNLKEKRNGSKFNNFNH